MPQKSSVAQPWRMQQSRYKLIGTECKNCGAIDFPPRRICSKCNGQETQDKMLSGLGVIETFTILHTAPEGFEGTTPYAIGIIRLKEGTMITAQIVGELAKIDIGKQVKMVFRRLYENGEEGLIHYGFKFEIIE